jgi:DNA polymerase V
MLRHRIKWWTSSCTINMHTRTHIFTKHIGLNLTRMVIVEIKKPAPLAEVMTLPLYGTRVPAGFPSPADDFIEDWIDLNRLLVKQKDATYFVKCAGDSMQDAGIVAGDLLVIDCALSVNPQDGWIVIACIDGDITLKRLRFKQDQMWLYPENEAKGYTPVRITEAMDFRIWGVVRSVIHQFIS